jgi:drug/metabolite transporter (DMT)-like permease
MADAPAPAPSRLLLIAAFAAVYIIWGSTYLAIKVAAETMPVWPMVGARHLLAGLVLMALLKLKGVPWPEKHHWPGAAVSGIMLLVIGNGLVAVSSKRIDSGVASLVVATTPLWLTGFAWLRKNGRAPTPRETIGLVLGLAGLAWLVAPGLLHALDGATSAASSHINARGVGLVLLGCISWAAGSLIGRDMPKPANAFMGSAMQMLVAGVGLAIVTALTGELFRVQLHTFSARSVWSFVYLIAVGSLLGFTAYIWLLRNTTPAKAATYAYVNPIVALFLGAWLGNETITSRVLQAAAITLAGVVLVVMPARTART